MSQDQMDLSRIEHVWAPQPGPQLMAAICPADIIFFGGSRGGGKTDAALGRQVAGAMKYGHKWSGLFLRKNFKHFKELRRRIDEMIINGLPAKRVGGDQQTNTIKFDNGARILLTAIEREEQLEFFQGQSFTELSLEEATQFGFINEMIDKLKACLRSPHGVPCHMFLTGNPGGPGHNAVKQRFIIPNRAGGSPIPDGDEMAIFIPSNVDDNQVLCQNDPKYVNRLKSIKDPNLRAAWLVGDWDVVMGGFFDDVWDEPNNVVPRFSVPEHWPRLMGLDWGTAKPFSVGWYAVSGGDYIPELGYSLPRGSLIRYAEWYGCLQDQANVGLRLNSDQVAQGILRMEYERGEDNLVFDRIADPSIFKVDDGPSIAEKFANAGVVLRRGDNRRIYGWDELRKLMAKKEQDDGSHWPMFYVTTNCEAFRRTVPVLERDEKEWDDLNTEGEDHVADETRYVVMSRPSAGVSKREQEKEELRPKYNYFRRDWDVITAEPNWDEGEDEGLGPANADDPLDDVLDAFDVTTERMQ